ncbi:DUF2950 domain-containing protein [Terriglobus sp. RCC_193]|uniref:DUF2950 domain-containing protein n=1 Tax=Terriglobus sp. RCC_193 TaxID=3239218 RepID=UPI003523E6D1
MSMQNRKLALSTRLLALALFLPLAACNRSDGNKAVEPSAKTFTSPEDAASALVAAVKSKDEGTILGIFGPDSKPVIYSGDSVEDKNAAMKFIARYEEMHRWRRLDDGSESLVIGADNYPFPIPLRKNADGKWFFDTAAGKEEVLSRRVGQNEFDVMDIAAGIADAQAEYFSQPHDGQPAKQYAAKFLSDPGKQNGLYWKTSEGQPPSPLGPLAASATAEGYAANPSGHTTFHGYLFKMLNSQTDKAPGGARAYFVDGKMTNGFAFVAYPAEYGNSGVMTFIMNQDGVLLEKDLGTNTVQTVSAMTAFDPDPSWKIVQ